MRPALHYGLTACPACNQAVGAGLEVEATGAIKRDKPEFQKGRTVVTVRTKQHPEGKVDDRGPRFGPQHEREWAELRHPECGRTFWRSGPQALEDARAVANGQPLRELDALTIPERLGGPPDTPQAMPRRR